MRPHHPMRTVEEVAAQMSGATVFSVLDAKSSFWQIKLDSISSLHTIFTTLLGRFKFNRMPFGINTTSEVFQRAMEQIFTGYPCAIIVDNIIIRVRDAKEHEINLKKVLDQARKDGRPVAYASRVLTETEGRYAQIEKELLAEVFTCHKFYDYIYGKPVVIETDHQPLVTIHNKAFHAIPACLQHMMLTLQKFNLTLTYKKGKHLYLADTLSCARRCDVPPSKEEKHEFEVMSVQLISPPQLDDLCKHTAMDPVLQIITQFIKNRWPRHIGRVPAEVKLYFNFCNELTVKDNIIMQENRAVIPVSLHSEYVAALHRGHPGMEATKRRSNGLSERAVRIAKKLRETMKRDGTDFYLNLLTLRNTQRDRILGFPTQRLLSRQTRTVLPICKHLLKPEAKSIACVKAQLKKETRDAETLL
ncbi:hypothetical protein SRHO_G00292050 [Serrasalmus rhombeus]